MEKGLSEENKKKIKEVIDIILDQIQLQETRSIKNTFVVWILSKKFNHLKDLNDLGRIIDKINEEKRILCVFTEKEFENSLFSKNGEPNKITEESIVKLKNTRSILELNLQFENEKYFYFVIEDLEKLKDLIKKLRQEPKVSKKTELVFMGVKGLCLNLDKKHCYSPRDNTRRYKYLEKILKSKGNPVSAKILNKYAKGKWNTNSSIVISQEISKINKLVTEKLRLKQKLILEESGYRLNIENYEIITT